MCKDGGEGVECFIREKREGEREGGREESMVR